MSPLLAFITAGGLLLAAAQPGSPGLAPSPAGAYPVVGTAQDRCYSETGEVIGGGLSVRPGRLAPRPQARLSRPGRRHGLGPGDRVGLGQGAQRANGLRRPGGLRPRQPARRP